MGGGLAGPPLANANDPLLERSHAASGPRWPVDGWQWRRPFRSV